MLLSRVATEIEEHFGCRFDAGRAMLETREKAGWDGRGRPVTPSLVFLI